MSLVKPAQWKGVFLSSVDQVWSARSNQVRQLTVNIGTTPNRQTLEKMHQKKHPCHSFTLMLVKHS
eukprot:8502172-Pyramimonas_sp.AAC.1